MGPLHGLVLILGARGSGKTTGLQAIVRRGLKSGARFVVSDRLGYWTARPGVRVIRGASHEEAARIAIQEVPYSTLVIDEIAEAFPTSRPPQPGSALSEIVRVGRNPCATGEWRRPGPVALIAAAQKPMNIHPDLKDLVDRLYIGKMKGKSNLRWIEDATTPEIAWACQRLKAHKFIPYDCT